MATKPTPVKPERPMPDTPEELAQAIFRDADRKLAEKLGKPKPSSNVGEQPPEPQPRTVPGPSPQPPPTQPSEPTRRSVPDTAEPLRKSGPPVPDRPREPPMPQ